MTEALQFHVNGEPVSVVADPATPLIEVLRNVLGLKGVHFGCGQEQCGACTVRVDGEPVYACTTAVEAVIGRSVATVEGLARGSELHPLQQAFAAEQAGQCGYCLPGILMSAQALLDRNPHPARADIVRAVDRHLCRCGSHARIVKAIERAAATARIRDGS